MRRRDFIAAIAGSTAASSLDTWAQQPSIPIVGFLGSTAPEAFALRLAAFRQGLNEGGYAEGRNMAIEFRWAKNDLNRLPGLAAELVLRNVAVIAVPGSTAGALAAKAATTTIPIV